MQGVRHGGSLYTPFPCCRELGGWGASVFRYSGGKIKLLGFWWTGGVQNSVRKDFRDAFMEKFIARLDFVFSLFKHQNAQGRIVLPCLGFSYDLDDI